MPFIPRRVACNAVLGILLAVLAGPTLAQANYPSKTIKFVNNFPPGGPSDILARSLADALQSSLKQTVIVENKAGARGNLGADAVAKSAADGYTVLVGIDTTFTINPHIYKTMAFKASDLKPVLIMASSGLLVGVNSGIGIKTMTELVARGKSKGLALSSGGSGSPGHLAAELFSDATQAKVAHIPYKGNTPAVMAVVAGEVDGGMLATPGMLPHVKSGKVTPMAVTSAQRSQLLPDTPTVAEAGLKDLEQEVLYLVMVPAATPEPVVQTLQKAMVEGLNRPDIQARMANLDLHPEVHTGADAAKRLQQTSERYARLARATGMKVE
ncbi:tripartite tricarboxylate transporter substrate binding protein [Cupriavidus basilensis]|uniref:Tripartite tricarboxylate transporter substrate binding protein n=1 Tax=Cupriavidus basilensis TaxID=68895 RepID=A0ABT6API1_9BURK|nr:tripartite tricarboxylate transporter substrate binding protein [Cupriavidus basilensis]MDF3834207.1 tripartite tricarboxylate transporter substrate binding protein [Cupriavidus basilensis]